MGAFRSFRSSYTLFFAPLAATGWIACNGPASSSSSHPPASTTSSPGDPPLTELPGNVSPFAQARFDVGRVDPATKLEGVSIFFKQSAAQKADARTLLLDIQNPMSTSYHRWLTPGGIAARFGASSGDIASTVSWLEAQGFHVEGPSPTRTRVFFSGTVGQIEQAFSTSMHHYEVHGVRHFALASAPSVPASLASFVLGLRGLHDFRLRPGPTRPPGPPRDPSPADLFDGGAGSETLTLAPADFATIYDLNPLYAAGIDGTGQKIGIMGEGDFNDADIAAFRTTFGLDPSLVPARDLVPLSGASSIPSYDTFGETELDLEWSGAVAKNASIYYVYTGSNPSYGVYDAVNWAIEEGSYPILSISYAGCELDYTPSENLFLETMGDAAAMEGITVVNGAGDWGAAECDLDDPYTTTAASYGLAVSWPASIPSFVAIGGTMLSWGDPVPEPSVTPSSAGVAPFDTYWSCSFGSTSNCSPKGYVPETAWNEMAYEIATEKYFWGAGGGGISTLFTKPYWQVGQTPAGTMRMLPDVSILAAYSQVGYMVSMSWTAADGDASAPYPEGLSVSGGTSAATPSFAGILALVNHALAKQNPSLPVGLGNANPVLYALNASTMGTATPAFHDITSGNNDVPCVSGSTDCPATPPYQFGYTAGPGYDLATGIGSVDGNLLVNAWTTLIPTAVTLTVVPSGTMEGATGALTAIVSSNAPSTGAAMTGSVLFYADTVDDAGLPDLALSATGTLTPTTTGGFEGGTATATVTLPPGLLGKGNIVAFYGGDAHYLAAWSSAASEAVTFSFSIAPASVTLAPNQQQTFTTTGGVPPVEWNIVRDSTCDACGNCSNVQPMTATTGSFQAGPQDGEVTLAAVDSDGAEVRAQILVTGAPIDGGTLDGDAPLAPCLDGGLDGETDADAETDATLDSPSEMDAPSDARRADGAVAEAGTSPDAGPQSEPPGSGCACRSAASVSGSSTRGALLPLLLSLVLIRRRRMRTRLRRR
jgi:hypothetical protein